MGFKLQSTLGTHTWVLKVTWVWVALSRGSTAWSGQGHIKVITRSNQLWYWIKTYFFYSFHVFFCCKEVFHKAAVDIVWLGSLPTRILGGTVTRLYVAWRGNIPLFISPVPSYITPCSLPALTSVQNEVNWSFVKSQNTWGTLTWLIKVTWFGVTFYWGSTLGSGQVHIKIMSRAKQMKYWIETLNSFHVFSSYWWPYCFGPWDDIET